MSGMHGLQCKLYCASAPLVFRGEPRTPVVSSSFFSLGADRTLLVGMIQTSDPLSPSALVAWRPLGLINLLSSRQITHAHQ